MKFCWKEFAFTAALFVISFGCLYAADAKAQTVGNMPATQNVHVCDGAACDDVPTVPAERQLKGLTDFIKSLLGPLESRVTDLETLVSSLLTRVGTLEGQVTTLQGQQAAAPTQGQITALQQQIVDLQAAVAALQAGRPGEAKAWWGRIGNNGSSSHKLVQTMAGFNMVLTFEEARPSADYAVIISAVGECYVLSRTVSSFTITCTGGANAGIAMKGVAVFDN